MHNIKRNIIDPKICICYRKYSLKTYSIKISISFIKFIYNDKKTIILSFLIRLRLYLSLNLFILLIVHLTNHSIC
jgi:hypothetical protein